MNFHKKVPTFKNVFVMSYYELLKKEEKNCIYLHSFGFCAFFCILFMFCSSEYYYLLVHTCEYSSYLYC